MAWLTTCWQIGEADFSVSERGPDRFTVSFGDQVRSDLSYADAAKEIGQAIMSAHDEWTRRSPLAIGGGNASDHNKRG